MSTLVKCFSNSFKFWICASKLNLKQFNSEIKLHGLHKRVFVIPVAQYRIMSHVDGELDDNERALKELDITLLKPHPEWRNVAAGPVWGKGNEYYELLWSHWLKETNLQKLKIKQDGQWKEYVEMYGKTPVDFLTSQEYFERYQNNHTWFGYIRNKKGPVQRQKTRRNCMKKDVVASGSPCALCRDENLLLTYNNIPLLVQFIDQLTGELHNSLRTGLCQNKQRLLVSTFKLAQDLGYCPKIVPFLKIDSEDYVPNSSVL